MRYRIKHYLEELDRAQLPEQWGDRQIMPNLIKKRQLFMVFEKGAMSPKHLKVLEELMDLYPDKIVFDFH